MTMDPAEQRDERVMGLVVETLQRPPCDRDSFLQSRCPNDPDLYREVSEIVTWEERMGDFLRRPLIEFIDLDALERIFEPGQVVAGRFEILRRVGDGGMGVVYEAHDNKLKKRIAIKCAKPGFDRLLSPELERAREVRHQNICLVNEIHTTNTELGELDFLTMEFLDGETLAHRLERGKLEEADALSIARQLCAGVAEAHRSQVMHRDLKPGNIILCRKKDGGTRAVITDFGLATEAGTGDELEGGTPNYMAPELWHSGKASQASDVFSLGVILYEMVTGCKPFPALTKDNVVFPAPVAPSKVVSNLPRRWDAAILPCLQEKPDQRGTAESVLAALEHEAFYRKPAVLVAIAACLALALYVTLPFIIAVLTPAPVRVAALPVQGPSDLVPIGISALEPLPGSIKEMQLGKPTAVSVIPFSRTLNKEVVSLDEAERVLGATHVLQLTLSHAGTGVAVEIELKTNTSKGNRSMRLSEADPKDLPAGLAGAVAFVLDVPRMVKEETVNPAAAAAYKEGRQDLDRTPRGYAHAICAFTEAARLDPHSPLPWAGLTEAYVRDFDENRGAGLKAKATCIADPRADQARDADPRDERKEATSALARAEALNADSPRVRLAAGLVHYFVENNSEKALNDDHRVQAISPENADAWIESGYVYEREGNLDQAIADYGKAIEISHHGYFRPYEYLGALNYFHGRYSEAEELFKKDIELRPDRVDAYGSLGAVYTKEFKYPDALEIHRKALKIKESPLTLNNIGAVLAFMGQDQEAIQYYRRALELKPDYYLSWRNLADALRRTKGLAAARAGYQRALTLAKDATIASPKSALYLTRRAYLEARLGLSSEAREHLAQAFALHSQSGEIELLAIETYEALGDRAQALSTAQTASAQTVKEAARHPNLSALQQDSEFMGILREKENQ